MRREYRLSVITVNYNGLKDTCSLLDSLTPVDQSTEVIVVDNASTSDEASTIASRYPWVRVIRSQKNLGFAGGNNLGIREANGEYLFFVNNDTEVDLSQLVPLLKRMDENESIAIVCPKIRFFYGDRKIQYAGYTKLSQVTLRNHAIGFGETDSGQHDTARPTPYVHGAAMLVRRKAIERAGMMPECFFLYYEELDWSMMMRRGGYEIWYDDGKRIVRTPMNINPSTNVIAYIISVKENDSSVSYKIIINKNNVDTIPPGYYGNVL